MSYISVNKHKIRKNIGAKEKDPPISVRKTKSGKPAYYYNVDIIDDDGNVVASLVYDPDKPILNCGARLVIETKNEPVGR